MNVLKKEKIIEYFNVEEVAEQIHYLASIRIPFLDELINLSEEKILNFQHQDINKAKYNRIQTLKLLIKNYDELLQERKDVNEKLNLLLSFTEKKRYEL